MRLVAVAFVICVLAPAAEAAQTAPAADNAYRSIIDRPLFDQTRRRYVPPPPPAPEPVVEAPAPAAPPDPSAPELLGVVTDQDQAIVVVRTEDGRVIRLGSGEAIDGWRVVAVRPRGIDVERAGVRQTLELPPPGSSVPPPL